MRFLGLRSLLASAQAVTFRTFGPQWAAVRKWVEFAGAGQ